MRALTVEELAGWVEGTSGPNDTCETIRSRFQKMFGDGTPRDVFQEMEKNLALAILAWTAKTGRSGK